MISLRGFPSLLVTSLVTVTDVINFRNCTRFISLLKLIALLTRRYIVLEESRKKYVQSTNGNFHWETYGPNVAIARKLISAFLRSETQ
jgi:hypothetical protein